MHSFFASHSYILTDITFYFHFFIELVTWYRVSATVAEPFFYFAHLQSALEPMHALTFCLAKLTISSGYCSLRNAFSAKSIKDLMLWKTSI